jgi:hypothetical protein
VKKIDVIAYFGTGVEVAKILDITPAAVSKWGSIIPELQAMKLERLTNGALKYNPALHLANAA